MFAYLKIAPIGVLLSVATPALAGPLVVIGTVQAEQRAVSPDGSVRVTLAAPRRVGPGDRIVFTLSYRNSGAQPLGDVVLANPVPRGIVYRAPMPGTPDPEVSVDGRRFGTLGDLRVMQPSGVARAATAADVVAVRWRLARPLAGGASGSVAFAGAVR